MPISLMQRSTCRAFRSMTIPSASRTSALPHWLEAPLLPCLAIFMPPPAATKAAAVEILKVFSPSPPVPTISSTGPGALTGTALALMTLARPVSSSAVSPLILSAVRKAASCEEVAVPSMISCMTPSASFTVSGCPLISVPMASLIMLFSPVQEIFQDGFPAFCHKGLWMKLDSLHRMFAVSQTHDRPIIGPGCDFQAVRQRIAFYYQ